MDPRNASSSSPASPSSQPVTPLSPLVTLFLVLLGGRTRGDLWRNRIRVFLVHRGSALPILFLVLLGGRGRKRRGDLRLRTNRLRFLSRGDLRLRRDRLLVILAHRVSTLPISFLVVLGGRGRMRRGDLRLRRNWLRVCLVHRGSALPSISRLRDYDTIPVTRSRDERCKATILVATTNAFDTVGQLDRQLICAAFGRRFLGNISQYDNK